MHHTVEDVDQNLVADECQASVSLVCEKGVDQH